MNSQSEEISFRGEGAVPLSSYLDALKVRKPFSVGELSL